MPKQSERSPKRRCFFASPSGAAADRLCAQVELALKDQDVVVEHWQTSGVGSVPDDIERRIASADVLLADLRDQNSNVMYEIGLARGMRRPLVLFARPEETIPFDVAAEHRIAVEEEDSEILHEHALREAIKTAVRKGLEIAAHRSHEAAKRAPAAGEARVWESLALRGHLDRLDADSVRTGTKVVHLDEGLGSVAAFSTDPDAVTVVFESGRRRGLELDDPSLFVAKIP